MGFNQSNLSIIMWYRNMVAAILNLTKMTNFELNFSNFAIKYSIFFNFLWTNTFQISQIVHILFWGTCGTLPKPPPPPPDTNAPCQTGVCGLVCMCVAQMREWESKCMCVWSKCVYVHVCGPGVSMFVCGLNVCVWSKCVFGFKV